MVQAGKARKYTGASSGHVTQRRESSEFFALSRQNDSQVASEQFGTQEGFTPVNQTGLQDVTKAPLSGAQFIGGIGFNRQLINLDEATGLLSIGFESGSGDVFDIPPGDASVIVIGGDGLTSDLSEIQFPKFNGHRLCLYLNALQTITIKNEPGAVVYKIKTGTGSDVVSSSGQERIIDFVWSITLGMWILVGASIGGGGAVCPVICDENDLGDVSGAVQVDWSLANFHRARLVGDTVFELINLPVDPKWQDICLEVLQDTTGGFAVSFTNGFDNGFDPGVNTGANRYTSWQIYTYENPAGTKIIQGFNKDGRTQGIAGNDWDGFAGFIQAKLSANQTTDLLVGDHIEFDTIVNNDKLTVTSPAPGQVAGIFSGFTRGHTYECECYLAGEGAGNTLNFGAQFFDRTTLAFIGTEGTNIAETGAVNRDSQFVAKALFNAVSVSDSLEVRITNNTVLTSILEGQATPSDGTCMVTIKDCGITEEAFNTPGIDPGLEDAILEEDIDAVPLPFDPNENPVFGEIDLAEMWHQAQNPGTSGDRFMQLNTTGSATTEPGQQTDMIRSGRVMQIHVNKIASGGGVRELSFRKNGADVLTMFFSVGTGLQVTVNNINVAWKAGDLCNWRMSGGIGGSERWIATMLVWYL